MTSLRAKTRKMWRRDCRVNFTMNTQLTVFHLRNVISKASRTRLINPRCRRGCFSRELQRPNQAREAGITTRYCSKRWEHSAELDVLNAVVLVIMTESKVTARQIRDSESCKCRVAASLLRSSLVPELTSSPVQATTRTSKARRRTWLVICSLTLNDLSS